MDKDKEEEEQKEQDDIGSIKILFKGAFQKLKGRGSVTGG